MSPDQMPPGVTDDVEPCEDPTQPQRMLPPAESSYLAALSVAGTQFPNHMQLFLDWHRLHFGDTWPEDQPQPGPAISVKVMVESAGLVRLGIPFGKGVLHGSMELNVSWRHHRYWDDGSVKWAACEWWQDEPGEFVVTDALGLTPPPYTVDAPSFTIHATKPDHVALEAYAKRYPQGEVAFVQVWNTAPVDPHPDNPNQPRLDYGNSNDALVDLAVEGSDLLVLNGEKQGCEDLGGTGWQLMDGRIPLRPGERKTFTIGKGIDPTPVIAYCDPEYYEETGALGDLTVPDMSDLTTTSYELNIQAGIAGIYERNFANPQPHWRNWRDFGELQRDWDGGNVDTDFQTHNDEYDVWRGLVLQAARYAGTETGRKAWRLAYDGLQHFSDIDIYHCIEGPFPFMHNHPFQHTAHGGSGHGDPHRGATPNTGHFNGRGLYIGDAFFGGVFWWDEACEKITSQARWKVENGPGMPGIPNTKGELRCAGNLLGVLLDDYEDTGEDDVKAAAVRVCDEASARLAHPIGSDGWRRAKGWQVAYFVRQLVRAKDMGLPVGGWLSQWQAFLADHCVKQKDGWTYLAYQVGDPPITDRFIDYMALWGADALVGFDDDLADELFRTGSTCIWYPGYPVGEYAKLNSSAGVCSAGEMYLARRRR